MTTFTIFRNVHRDMLNYSEQHKYFIKGTKDKDNELYLIFASIGIDHQTNL